MKQLLLFIIALFQTSMVLAQSQQDDLAFSLRAAALPIYNDYRLGAEASLQYYIKDDLSVGGKFQYTFNNFNHGFGYDTPKAIVHYLNISTPIQYDVINDEKFQLGFGLAPGISLATLRDRTQLKEKEYYDDETGIVTVVKMPIRLNRDAYFTLTPNIDFSYKLTSIEKNSNTALYLSGNAGYQFSMGAGDFTNSNSFRNYVVSLGFTIKGTTK